MIIIQCVLSPSIFKPLTLFTSFLKYNICWNLQTTEAKVIYLQTATSPRLGPSLQKHLFYFFYSRWCEFAIKHSEDRSISDSFWCSKHSQTQPALYKSKTTKSWQIIPQKLYIWLGNRKAEEKTDWDKHYIATSAKCIVGRRREMMFSCFTQWRHQNDEHVILFMICTTYVFTSFP